MRLRIFTLRPSTTYSVGRPRRRSSSYGVKRRAVETVWLHATPRVKPRLTTGTPWSAAPITFSLPGIVRCTSYQRSEPCHGKCVLLSSSARSPLAPSRPMPRPLEPSWSAPRRRLKACGSILRAALAFPLGGSAATISLRKLPELARRPSW